MCWKSFCVQHDNLRNFGTFCMNKQRAEWGSVIQHKPSPIFFFWFESNIFFITLVLSQILFFLHNMKQRERNDFFFATLYLNSFFFLKEKLISTSTSFLYKKNYYDVRQHFFKKRDTKGFQPKNNTKVLLPNIKKKGSKNKDISRGTAEKIHDTWEVQFSRVPQKY